MRAGGVCVKVGAGAEEATTFGGSTSTSLSLKGSGGSTAFQRCRASSTASGDTM
jgi:hypothetical protein